jgi:phosphoserine phosphatase RsbU/P
MRNKYKTRTLSSQLISFLFLFLFVISFTSILIVRHFVSKLMLSNAQESIGNLAREKVNQLDKSLMTIEALGENFHSILLGNYFSQDEMNNYIRNMLQSNPNLLSICIAYQDNDYDSRAYSLQADTLAVRSIKGKFFHYNDWYQIPYLTDVDYWSDPWYDDLSSDQMVCSYSLPIEDKSRRGVIRVDIPYNTLIKSVSDIKVKQTGYAYLVSHNGTFVAHPADSLCMNYTIFDLAEELKKPQLRQIGRDIISGKNGFVNVKKNLEDKNDWLYYQPFDTNHWSLVIVVPNSEVFMDLNNLLAIISFSSILTFCIMAAAIYARVYIITKPLNKVVRSIQKVGHGQFDTPLLPQSGTYEIRVISDAVDQMTRSLQKYIVNLQQVTTEKNRIENEIMFASAIQRNLIPNNDDSDLKFEELSAVGILEPAGAIGGDLYDYFRIGDNSFCFIIADVVGKGVAAGMTMTMTVTLLRTIAQTYNSPDHIFREMNNLLIKNKLESNFITAILGIIDLTTMTLTYSNAGHVPWFILAKDGKLTKYATTQTNPLGFVTNPEITCESVQLQVGDQIILCTDGITEAQNDTDEMFGISRLEEYLSSIKPASPDSTIQGILHAVDDFILHKSRTDDTTILVVELRKTGSSPISGLS